MDLTHKEREVLQRYARGEQVPDIAKDLGVHIQSIYARLNRSRTRLKLKSRIGLVHYAIKTGLVEVGDAR